MKKVIKSLNYCISIPLAGNLLFITTKYTSHNYVNNFVIYYDYSRLTNNNFVCCNYDS